VVASLVCLIVGVGLILATLYRPTLDRVLAFMRYTEHVPFWDRLSEETQDRVMRSIAFGCGVIMVVVGALGVAGVVPFS
jgi:hypothetical protein